MCVLGQRACEAALWIGLDYVVVFDARAGVNNMPRILECRGLGKACGGGRDIEREETASEHGPRTVLRARAPNGRRGRWPKEKYFCCDFLLCAAAFAYLQ